MSKIITEIKQNSRVRFCFLLIVMILGNFLIAQESDYEIVEAFKLKYSKLTTKIDSSSNDSSLNTIKEEINQLSTEYFEYKDLINESLYPENFTSIFEKIEKQSINARNRVVISKDLESTKIKNADLNVKLVKLTTDYDKLSNDNSLLSKQIKFLQKQSKKDKKTISRINSLLSDLRTNIRKRDDLVVSMVDSLFGDFDKPKLTDIDKKRLFNNVDNNNFFEKIIFTINQNIKFLESSPHTAEGISFAVMEYEKFVQLWGKISPNLLKTYIEKDKSAQVIEMLNEKFSEWQRSLEIVTWFSLDNFFKSNSIATKPFLNRIDFRDNIIAYIDDQILNPNEENNLFSTFVDTVWNNGVKTNWTPILLGNNYIVKSDIDQIEAKITEWKSSSSNWVLIVSLIIIAIIILIFVLKTLLNVSKDDGDNNNDGEQKE